MSSNKEEKGDAAERIKAAALTAAKGLSRAQAERAAVAAARNVNAYGQKEEGPSRWQERKEAKRQMYLMSTEKQVRLGERKDKAAGSMSATTGGATSQCQKCYQTGHWTYECKNERVYISRPSCTQQLKNPKLRTRFLNRSELDYPDIIEEEEPKVEKKSLTKNKSKRKHRSDTESESGSEASVFESDSGSDDESSAESETSSSSLSSLDSREQRRRRKKKKNEKKKKQSKGKHHRKRRYSSSSESESESESDSELDSDSDSEDRGSRRKSGKRHSRKR